MRASVICRRIVFLRRASIRCRAATRRRRRASFEVYDEWMKVLPTDQIVAVEVNLRIRKRLCGSDPPTMATLHFYRQSENLSAAELGECDRKSSRPERDAFLFEIVQNIELVDKMNRQREMSLEIHFAAAQGYTADGISPTALSRLSLRVSSFLAVNGVPRVFSATQVLDFHFAVARLALRMEIGADAVMSVAHRRARGCHHCSPASEVVDRLHAGQHQHLLRRYHGAVVQSSEDWSVQAWMRSSHPGSRFCAFSR